ncbi:TPA: alpha/beta fold hydrolase [Serratia marcescens]|uniref:thioesterase II family protein n=3 Tax=Serratia TaxID=613 RepID=UPI0018D8C56F|nr:alpha/beta fold hydrolase [Serratia marcescens]EIT1092933.1 thioesterase [Serratia marcescens]ELD1855636.1 thioesterase [Serratia marcescens]ELM0004415.1 thioesterase [Serratia marcescens]MBH2739149.1 thioesterase [Serratia marcescens]MBH3222586.1 thioesterase [Serratia marcescens]
MHSLNAKEAQASLAPLKIRIFAMHCTHFPNAPLGLKPLTPGRQGSLRLIAFPHAGAGATAFQRWGPALHQDIELYAVQYPGREERAHEAPLCQPQSLINQLIPALQPLQDKPLIFFGHSLGGRVALALAMALPQPPLQLIISACSSPFLARHSQLLRMPRAALLNALCAGEGLDESLIGDSALVDYYLPLIRADLLLSSQLLFPAQPGYHAPLAMFYGENDELIDRQDLLDWRRIAQGDFQQRTFAGGHMYITTQREAVIAGVHQLLAGRLSEPASR